jgi:probable rRNA maturation factor
VLVSGAAAGLASRTTRAAVEHVLASERQRARISVAFVGKSRMRRLNAKFLHHDYPTDVISFPLPQPDGSVAGEICICRHVAARHARAHGESVRNELLRLVIHGTLHVLGWDHPDRGRTRSEMWRRQERYLAAIR